MRKTTARSVTQGLQERIWTKTGCCTSGWQLLHLLNLTIIFIDADPLNARPAVTIQALLTTLLFFLCSSRTVKICPSQRKQHSTAILSSNFMD
ncbi:unnamed protein product [Calypogeia fissa]